MSADQQITDFDGLKYIWANKLHLKVTLCLIQGCKKEPKYIGLCTTHCARYRQRGTPFYRGREVFFGTNEERFLKYVRKIDNGCWLWMGPKVTGGYGSFYIWKKDMGGGKSIGAHRWAYENWVSVIEQGKEIDHICRNRPCVNPEHLRQVTHLENMHLGDTVAAINARKTHCPKNHELSGRNILWERDGSRKCRTCAYARRTQRKTNLKSLEIKECPV